MTARAVLGLWGLLAAGAVGACRAQVPPPATAPAPTLQERAFAAERAERFAEAADAFLALARAEPLRVDWVVAAGRCLGRCGRLEEAADLLVAARRTFPGSIEVDTTLAKTYLLLAEQPETMAPRVRWAEAAELAAQVLEAAPDDEESRLILAQATYLLGDAARARAEAEEAVRRHPRRSGAHVLLGRIAMDRFAALLRRHAEEQPEGQAAADLVAAIDAERQLATRSFRRAAELAPERAHPHVALAQLALLDRRTAAARAHLLDALAIDPDTPFEHRLFDQELDWQQRRTAYAEALRRYDQGGAALPAKRATLQWYEARALYDGGQWREARDGFAAALAAQPRATHSHYYLALCHYRLGDLDAATREAAAYARVGAPAFADVVRGLPGDTRGEVGAIVQFLADRAFRAGDIAASRDLNHVIACLADSADAWNNHAFLCRETGQFEAALASYLHAQEKEPDSPQLLNDTAVVLHYHLPPTPANRAKAAGLYERAIQLADKLLANAQVQGVARDRARQAKADATANLAALAAK